MLGRSTVLALALAFCSLLLADDITTGTVLLALVLGFAIERYARTFLDHPGRSMRLGAVPRLAAYVLWDILVANLQVARRVLGPLAAIKPQFICVPVSLTDPTAIAALVGIINITPGTVSAGLSADHRVLTIHALDAVDVDALIALIKWRYEAPLKEIFECST